MKKPFDVNKIREDFPILKRKVYGKPLVYFDNAATTQKPADVINAIDDYYKLTNSNVHRGVHFLSNEATDHYEASREKIRAFINAASTGEIIFVRGTTEAINLVAHSYGMKNFRKGDEIVITALEHHANIVPWQMICEATGAVLKVVPVTESGELIYDEYKKLLSEKTRFVSVAHISNVLGTINPIKKIIDDAHGAGAKVLIDGAQAIQHLKVDVRQLDCDFYVFSSHKIYGPTGTGVLYGKENILDSMPPYQTGGEMIQSVSFEKTTFNELPYKFEAGT
ncbi:MAG TPA: aminotransferase class V-fold PLP-dependent enzyme, partial [Ignavibacteria bacterium]|nr:aminotransferase class V-fold PLP-dependent enzyme [Ignavibacteria bacterium]